MWGLARSAHVPVGDFTPAPGRCCAVMFATHPNLRLEYLFESTMQAHTISGQVRAGAEPSGGQPSRRLQLDSPLTFGPVRHRPKRGCVSIRLNWTR